MKAKEIMSKNVACMQADESVERAAQLMKQYGCGSIPICCSGKVEGIVTDRDIALRCIAEGKDAKQQKVSDIMTASPATGNPEMDVNDAVRLMSEKQVRRLPIMENNSIVGIVALGDISTESNQQESAGSALNSISQPSSVQM
jgi:CBS domain-containing protein